MQEEHFQVESLKYKGIKDSNSKEYKKDGFYSEVPASQIEKPLQDYDQIVLTLKSTSEKCSINKIITYDAIQRM